MQKFSFKPAALRGQQDWVLDGDQLSCEGGPAMRLDQIEGGRFSDMQANRILTSTFKLQVGGRNVSIVCNDRRTGPPRIQYLNMCFAMLARLADIKPDVKFDFGPPPITGILMSVMMAAMAVFAVITGFIVVGDMRGSAKWLLGGLFGLIAIAGIIMAVIWAPRKSDKKLTPAELINAIRISLGAQPIPPRTTEPAALAEPEHQLGKGS